MENLVPLSPAAWNLGSVILMVSYGAHFAFAIFFLVASTQLAPRYRLVAWLSALVMLSAGLSLLREWSSWNAAYTFSLELAQFVPVISGDTFTNVYRYGNWTITVPLLLCQLPLAFGLPRRETYSRVARMGIAGIGMIWTGLIGQIYEVDDLILFNVWGVISTVFFAWLLWEVRGVLRRAATLSTPGLEAWPRRLFFYMVATWGIYPIAYALPQLGFNEVTIVLRQGLFSLADISTKLIYGVILSRYCLRRSAREGYLPALEALGEGTNPETTVAAASASATSATSSPAR